MEDDATRTGPGAAAGVFLGQPRLQREAAAGLWPNRVLTEYLEDHARNRPRTPAVVAWCNDTASEVVLSYGELRDRVERIATNLRRLGVGPGDVVSFQLPNCWEFTALHLACNRAGAVSNPLMPIFRRREMEFMVERAGSELLITPERFRNFDHAQMARDLQRSIPRLRHVLSVGRGSGSTFATELLEDHGAGSLEPGSGLVPDDVVKLMYTSGTTGEPKGILHTSNTLLCAVQAMIDRLGLDTDDVLFMPSPFAHSIGFIYGVMMAVVLGVPLVTMEIWDASLAVDLMGRHAVSFAAGASPFMADLVSVPGIGARNLDRFRIFLTGGAPVPPALVDETSRALRAAVIAGYGMTELGFVSTTLPDRVAEGRDTDGIALPCCEARVVGPDRVELPRGSEGDLQCRGSTLFVGYYRRPDLYAVDADGWFDTGDLARMNDSGYLRITGRTKDIIIRGGENIPVVEVEKLIYEMPQVSGVALVAMPDARLGEKICAFVTLHRGQELKLEQVIGFLGTRSMARQYMPDRLEILGELPRTPAGKVQKFVLRDLASRLVRQP